MDEEEKGLYTVAEAAEAWGISKQAVYQRLNKLNKEGLLVEQGRKRYITRECFEVYPPIEQGLKQEVEQEEPIIQPTLNKLNKELEQAKAELLAEQGKTSTLQATVTAQEAHIESLKAALDKAQTTINQEQAIRMASLQKRLPAPGKGFFAWLRGKKSE
jgi:DNA-binding transcriptional regulator GbsR (MarR family)